MVGWLVCFLGIKEGWLVRGLVSGRGSDEEGERERERGRREGGCRVGKGREGKGREGKGREGKGREGKGKVLHCCWWIRENGLRGRRCREEDVDEWLIRKKRKQRLQLSFSRS